MKPARIAAAALIVAALTPIADTASAAPAPPADTLTVTCSAVIATATDAIVKARIAGGALIEIETHGTAKLVFAPHAAGTLTAEIDRHGHPTATRRVVCT